MACNLNNESSIFLQLYSVTVVPPPPLICHFLSHRPHLKWHHPPRSHTQPPHIFSLPHYPPFPDPLPTSSPPFVTTYVSGHNNVLLNCDSSLCDPLYFVFQCFLQQIVTKYPPLSVAWLCQASPAPFPYSETLA